MLYKGMMLMKLAVKITSVLCTAVIAVSAVAVNVSAAKQSDWKSLYSDFLHEELKDDYDFAFSIFDIDGNGTPELILSPGNVHLSQCGIYTVSDGKLTLVDNEVGSNGICFCVPAKHYVISSYMGMGAMSESYFTLGGSTLTPAVSFYNDEYAVKDGDPEYTINDKKVTAEEYEKEYEKYHSPDEICLGRTYPLSNSSIEYAVNGVKNYKQGYAALLRDVYTKNEGYSSVFSLMDITGDNIPELFVRSNVTTDIYTFADGRVQYMHSEYLYLMSYDSVKYSYGYSSDKKMLVIRAYSEKDSARSYTFLKYGKNGLTEQADIRCSYNADGEYVYQVNGKEVTKSGYKKALKKYSSIKFRYISDKKIYSVKESVIKKILA